MGVAGSPVIGRRREAFSTLLRRPGLRASSDGVLATKSERKMLASTCLYSPYAWFLLRLRGAVLARYMRWLSACPSVCLSVCLSQANVLSKRLSISSSKQRRTSDCSFLTSKILTKFHSSGVIPKGAKYTWVGKLCDFRQIAISQKLFL